MDVDIAGGSLTFRRHIAVPGAGPIPGGGDADPGMVTSPVINDGTVRHGYVSLQSPNVRIAAAELTITELGDIRRLGWVNVIRESRREYHYQGALVVSEWTADTPTWDGGVGETAPYYFGQWFAVDEEDEEEDGCLGVLEVDEEEDVIFNDAPCMPPSYNVYESGGVPLGKINLSPAGYRPNRLREIQGLDRYLACLTVEDDQGAYHVAWSIPWDVTFRADVNHLLHGGFQVALDPAALTRVNVAEAVNANLLVAQVAVKQDGETLKRYGASAPIRWVRNSLPGLPRTKSLGDLGL